MSRSTAVDQFYDLLARLEQGHGHTRKLSDCGPQSGWPEAGIYFFYEPGEVRESAGARVVRVGTHRLTATSSATLWDRLSQHRGSAGGGGNHRGSIFRLHVGTALLNSGLHLEAHPTWGTKHAPPVARQREVGLERAVSEYIRAMPFHHVGVRDRFNRATIEAGAIGLLSNFERTPIDPASPGWLGHRADRVDVRDSHLWNVRHVRDAWSDTWLDTLSSVIEGEELPMSAEEAPSPQGDQGSARAGRGTAQQQFTPDLWTLLNEHAPAGTTVRTLGHGKANTVVELHAFGMVLQTDRSISRGSAGELVPAWMFNRAWERLTTCGQLTRDELLEGLNVKRSSAVFAVLARLPGVTHTARPISLHLDR